MSSERRNDRSIERVELKVGMEVHVELRTRRKMFAAAPSPAHPDFESAEPNTLIDPTVLGLPGALPVMNKAAVEMSALVGLALGCSIAGRTKWDRKSYFYPDLPKAYQISQYDLPLCFDGVYEVPALDDKGRIDPDGPTHRVGIVRAHLEEDAGKLSHEGPGGAAIAHSNADYNRAGAALLEIVTQPDFTSADQCVAFAQSLRRLCRWLGVTEGVMQKGHMRFEPNINCVLHLSGGSEGGKTVSTPITEVKNLNSFRSLRGAIEHELREQPKRWLDDGRELGPGTKTTRGWDDAKLATVLQREKEDAHDYRYFPDPDLPPVEVGEAWLEEIRARLPETPMERTRSLMDDGLAAADAATIVEERSVSDMLDAAVARAIREGADREEALRAAANLILQAGQRLANERGTIASGLGVDGGQLGVIASMRAAGDLGAQQAERLFEGLASPERDGADPRVLAEDLGLLVVRDDAQLDAWVEAAIAEQPDMAEQVRGGNLKAAGRLMGAIMKASGGSADAMTARQRLLEKLGQ